MKPLFTAVAAAAALLVSHSFAAQAIDAQYLVNESNSRGAVRVMVTLDNTVTLDALKKNLPGIKAKLDKKEKALRAELGTNALDGGYWSNGLGQVGVYVNAAGLSILSRSANVQSYMPDRTHGMRTRAYDLDGSLEAIENKINTSGYADVDIAINHDDGEYDLDKSGKTVFKPSSALTAELGTRINRLKAEKFAKGISGLETAYTVAVANGSATPMVTARIDKNAFFAMREHQDVRAMRLVGQVDQRAAQWPQEVVDTANAQGTADVLISLRGSASFSPKSGYMSAKAQANQTAAHKRAFDDIFSSIGYAAQKESHSTNYFIGTVHAQLNAAQVQNLYAKADQRILSVRLNKPVATAALLNSTVLMNMPLYWPSFNGAGQNIIIIDSGVQRNHSFLSGKVVYEACYGTRDLNSNPTYLSPCPGADGNGDSAPGTIGSGEPASSLFCLPAGAANNCSHGTSVAGIAAGRSEPFPSGRQGVAPGASLVSIQVYSYGSGVASALDADVEAALRLATTSTTQGTFNNPRIVNLSMVGPNPYTSTTLCTGKPASIDAVIADLISLGIPVIAATGNDNNSIGANGMKWPSCAPNVIAVGAVTNDATGTQVANYSNLGIPGNYSNVILLAPGGGNPIGVPLTTPAGTSITSSTTGGATAPVVGTSSAAPHVAGLYAVLKAFVASHPENWAKGMSVADISGFVIGTYSIPVSAYGQTYRRVRLP